MNNYINFIITVDTEGDNLWAVSDIKSPIGTENAKYLFRFQELCERYGMIPTYLTNYEMARAKAFIELGRDGLKRGTLEIGAHEHAWNQPPYFPLPKQFGKRGKPYLGEYPQPIIRRKLEYLTKLLEDTFQCAITSHRGGRWCLDGIIARELERLGYIADCTCTPGISWKSNPGWSFGSRGTDWSDYQNRICKLEYMTISGKKTSSLTEVPVTIAPIGSPTNLQWLRPYGRNRREMIKLLQRAIEKKEMYVEFMIHSSELMPGGSPTFDDERKIERLYNDLVELFSYARLHNFKGIGLSDFVMQ